MYSIEMHSSNGITPVRTGRTLVTTGIFIKINAFGTLTGTTDVVQVVPCKINEFSVHFRYTGTQQLQQVVPVVILFSLYPHKYQIAIRRLTTYFTQYYIGYNIPKSKTATCQSFEILLGLIQ